MAFVLDTTKKIGTGGVTSNSITFSEWFTSNDDLQAGDYIMVCAVAGFVVAGVPFTISSGWNRLDNIDPPNVTTALQAQVWWRKYDGTPIPAPTIGGSNSNWAVTAWVVRDAPDVADQSWIDANVRSDISTQERIGTIPSVTTTENDCLLLTVFGANQTATVLPYNFWGVDFNVIRTTDNLSNASATIQNMVASRSAPTAGATPTYDYSAADRGRWQIWTIAIKNKINGTKPIGVFNPPIRITDLYENNTITAASLTDISLVQSSIDGYPTRAGNSLSIATLLPDINNISYPWGWARRIALRTFTDGLPGASGVVWNLPSSANLTVGLWCCFFQAASVAQDDINGFYHYFEDASGNWAVYQFVNKLEQNSYLMIIRNMVDEVPVDGSVTPLDLSNITKRGIIFGYSAAVPGIRTMTFRSECVQPFDSPITFTGGGAKNPVNARRVAQCLTSGAGHNLAFVQGQGQQVVTMPFQLGDGSVSTYVENQAQYLEYPRLLGVVGYNLADNLQEIKIKASSNDTILFDAGLLGTSTPNKITIDPTSSTSATYGFVGTFIGFNITAKSGIDLSGGTFISCGKIDGKGADFSNGRIRQSVATDAALRLEDGGAARGTEFIKGAETYAIEIQGTGTISLAKATFTGYTKPINVLATTGTVTIELDLSDTQPAFDTAGATVAFTKPQSSFTINNIVANSRLLIRRTDTQEVLVNEIISGTSKTYTYIHLADIPVEIVLRKATGSPTYQEWKTIATLTGTGGSVTANQQLDE